MSGQAVIGIVVIGRNEGDRLGLCLAGLRPAMASLIYVDSGSKDNSVSMAKSMGAEVVELDPAVRFTAARARNAGLRRLLQVNDVIDYVQFVDGDCEVMQDWIATAVEFLDREVKVAAVCGRVRERFPEVSVYNLVCDMEWNGPAGEIRACGGNAMYRLSAFRQVSGFREDLIAGEEPELCVRLRDAGWRIWRLEDDMVWHDVAILRFGQWFRRSVRTGHAFAEGAHLHGQGSEKHGMREAHSAIFWGLSLPLFIMLLVLWIGVPGFLVLGVYPAQVIRLAIRGSRSKRENWIRAFFLVLAKFPEAIGNVRFHVDRLVRRAPRLIEYK